MLNTFDKIWKWRKNLEYNKYPVRYPVGFHHRRNCLFAIKELPNGKYKYHLNYVEARKEIYMPVYIDLVENRPQFKELQERLNE